MRVLDALTGRVILGASSSVWFGCVLRGDLDVLTPSRRLAREDRAERSDRRVQSRRVAAAGENSDPLLLHP